MASAPTEYNPAARPSKNSPAPPAYSSTRPVTIAAPQPRLDSVGPTVPQQRSGFAPHPTSPWSIPFIALFSIILLLLIAGSVWTFNIEHPYGSGNPAGLDHAVELGLSLFLLLVILVASTIVRNFAARTILLVASLPALVAGLRYKH
jgi:hypothetical protein